MPVKPSVKHHEHDVGGLSVQKTEAPDVRIGCGEPVEATVLLSVNQQTLCDTYP